MKKIITILFSLIILSIGAFLGWNIYRNTTWAVIDISQLQNMMLEKIEENLILSGNANLGFFEGVATVEVEKVDNAIYIYVMKTSAIFPNTQINQNISNIIKSNNFIDFQRIYLVSGENIIVEFPNEPTRNTLDVTRYSDKIELSLMN